MAPIPIESWPGGNASTAPGSYSATRPSTSPALARSRKNLLRSSGSAARCRFSSTATPVPSVLWPRTLSRTTVPSRPRLHGRAQPPGDDVAGSDADQGLPGVRRLQRLRRPLDHHRSGLPRGQDVVDDEGDLRIRRDVAELLGGCEVQAGDVDRAKGRVVAPPNRNDVG